MNDNNILSYFIKDIKDPIECSFYKQIKSIDNYSPVILYKNNPIFEIGIYFVYNYKFNICKTRFTNAKYTYKISVFDYYKLLYYKHDKKAKRNNINYISFDYICKKYLIKTDFEYINNSILLNIIKFKYYNGYKYIFKQYNYQYAYTKYTTNIILIMNKYELYYYNKFFNLYFGL